ncbi:hypothetical protein VHEMI07574 [[Torrubiella] hemipterigena]|uniref:Phosphatidylinositol-specific phospholipase C X domain-containing protein n=1 Tax=[Torrubiella] hemipterigena TaxID=1531966 RepID=A0A0A1TAT9_9HYPO|nr:hypothetical protein VHEMI07574 [[Torrubiella] hemipterigena]
MLAPTLLVYLQHLFSLCVRSYLQVSQDDVTLATMRHNELWASLAAVACVFQPVFSVPLENCARDADTCQASDRTYSNEVPRAGSYQPWSLIKLGSIGFPAKQYVTIVNLTPHRFVLDRSRTHSYQFDVFDWDDIPQGRSRQNTAAYTSKAGKNDVDDNGEAFYNIQGTNKGFMIRKTTHIPDDYPRRTVFDLGGMGLGAREYLDPGKESAVTLVITGSDTYGFTASLRHGPGNWMKGLYDVIKDRKVQHLYLPGTHDSGMSTISGDLTSIGTAVNTQTQGVNLYDQMRAGARLFDLRVFFFFFFDHLDLHKFYTLHVNDETAEVAVGNTGLSLDQAIDQVNQFTRENPGEIVFFRVRYLIGIRQLPVGGPVIWDNAITNEFFGKLRQINNRCPNLDQNTQFSQQKASYFMDQNGGKGCVLFLLNGSNLPSNVPHDSPGDGLYKDSMMNVWDNWSNLPDTKKMADDQVAKWKTVSRSGNFQNDQFLISQWLVSADALTTTALSIQDIAIQPTNPALYWMGLNNMSPEIFPTVSLIDYIGVVVNSRFSFDQLSAEMYTFAIGMNLYMISENCAINTRRSPLLPGARKAAQKLAVSEDGSVSDFAEDAVVNPLASDWNGFIYSNGTVVDQAPEERPGQEHTLKAGTVFMNGTVLTHEAANPNV